MPTFFNTKETTLGVFSPEYRSWVAPGFRNELMLTLQDLVVEKFNTFLVVPLPGFATAFGDQVIELRDARPELGLRLVSIVPFDGHERGWPEPVLKSYRDLLNRSDRVYTVTGKAYSAEKLDHVYQMIVDESARVYTYQDGSKRGPCYRAIQYAARKKVEVINFYNKGEGYASG